jgi:hypothetical protein
MGKTLKAQIVQPEDVAYIWEEVAPLLEKVKEHTEGEFETDDYLEPLTNGNMHLWIATEYSDVKAAMVTQFAIYPQKNILRIVSMAGDDFEEIRGFQDMIEAFAVRMGCSALEMWGRKGWKKLLPDWNDTYIVYTKDLKHRMQ